MSRFRFTSLLLCSTAIISTPVMADASLDELKAKLEKAEKENIILKTEKIERENVAMKLEKIEAENAALRNEAKVDKTPTASIPPQQHASAPAPAPQARAVARKEIVETVEAPQREHASTRAINKALASIPKDDERREMTAVHKAQITSEIISEKPWQGVYVGLTAGYGANDVNTYSTTVGYAAGTFGYSSTPETIIGGGINSQYFSGPVAGGIFGYNHQFSNGVIVGAESDVVWADINNNSITNTNSSNYVITPSIRNITSTNVRTGLNWLGTSRIRFGYALGNFLPYITGGLAYGELSTSGASGTLFGYGRYSSTDYNNLSGSYGGGNYSSVNLGWSLGAGAEYFVANNWSVKGEYLYTQLSGLKGGSSSIGIETLSGQFTTPASSAGPILTSNTMGDFGIHQVRVGLNYHTGWLNGLSGVTAKY